MSCGLLLWMSCWHDLVMPWMFLLSTWPLLLKTARTVMEKRFWLFPTIEVKPLLPSFQQLCNVNIFIFFFPRTAAPSWTTSMWRNLSGWLILARSERSVGWSSSPGRVKVKVRKKVPVCASLLHFSSTLVGLWTIMLLVASLQWVIAYMYPYEKNDENLLHHLRRPLFCAKDNFCCFRFHLCFIFLFFFQLWLR